jgi:hypothetical protein
VTTGDHFYTTAANERDDAVNQDGYHVESIACYVLTNQAAGSAAFMRLFNASVDDHFYTTSVDEANSAVAHAGYHMEGTACYILATQEANTAPLFRLFNDHDPKHHDHFYTNSAQERDMAVANDGYSYEGIAGFVYADSQPGDCLPLWRLFNQPHPVQQAKAFNLTAISYDTAKATVQATTAVNLYEDDIANNTSVSQTSELDGSQTVTDTSGWSNTISSKIDLSVSAKVSIPAVVDFTVTVSAEESQSYTWNGSESYSTTWSWKQPVTVPADSVVHAKVSVSQSTVLVPYTMTGEFTFSDGSSLAGMVFGTYKGVCSHDLQVTLT